MYNPYGAMYSPYANNAYNNYLSQMQMPQQVQNTLPQQQIIQVNGKASVDTMQMPPNSSVLVMDTSAPIVWLCVSDGVGKVSATAYDITPHQDTPPVDVNVIEKRLLTVETAVAQLMEGLSNGSKSNARSVESKQNDV